MPTYVSLAQQGFFQPFEAMGRNASAVAGLLQQQAQMKQQKDLADQRLALERDEFSLKKPLIQSQIDDAQLATQQKKAADVLHRHDFTEDLRPVLSPTPEDRKAFPNQDLGTGLADFVPADLSSYSPEVRDQLPETAKFKRVWRPINLDNTPFHELSPDVQRFAVGQVNAKAEKAGAGPISAADIAAAYRQKQIEKMGPTIGENMEPWTQKLNEQTGAVETEYRRTMGGGAGSGSRPALSAEDYYKQVQGYGKDSDAAFGAYHAAVDAQKVLAGLVEDAKAQEGSENSAAINDPGILLEYMRTLNPNVTRNPQTGDLENTSGIPEKVVEEFLKVSKGERMTQEKRERYLKLATDNVENHRRAGALHVESIRYRAAREGIPSEEFLNPKLIENQVTAPATHEGHGGKGFNIQPGTFGGPSASPKHQFNSLQEFNEAARVNSWPSGTKGQVYDPQQKRYREARIQ